MTWHVIRGVLILTLLAPSAGRVVGAPSEDDEIVRKLTVSQIPTQGLAEPVRSKVIDVLHKPTTYVRGPVEAFPCQPTIYDWLLENPHWGFRAWRALGVKCATVDRKDDGTFRGVDPQGSELQWQCIHCEPGRHVWYAEGSGKPTLLAPNLSMRVVVVLNHQEVRGSDGRIGIRHRAELFAQYDSSKASGWAMKLYGLTADAVGKKAVEQLELFFSGLSWYVSENPNWARTIFKPSAQERAEEVKQLTLLLQILPALATDAHKLPPTAKPNETPAGSVPAGVK